jgi:anion-transporting  ArsA/GET3 family ATPase
MKTALDQMVRRLAKPDRVELVLNHRIYKALGEMAGMQELMAMEQIGQALGLGFDSIMVDTAPSRHALEFLDKPKYLVDLVSAPMVKLIGRTYRLWERSPLARLSRMGMDLYGQVEALVGGQLTRDVLEFFSAFQGVAEGYAKHAEKTLAVLRDPAITGFTLVSTPFKARADAAWFPAELAKRKFAVERLVVNRVWPALEVQAAVGADEEASELVAWYHRVSAAHAGAVDAVRKEVAGKIPDLMTLRELSTDIDGVAALYLISQALGSA